MPDHNQKALELIYKFILDFKPDTLHILGDFLNCTSISKYETDPYYGISFADEINLGKVIIEKLLKHVKKVNPDSQVIYSNGNHEARLLKFLSRQADELAGLNNDGEYILSIPHLLELKKHKIKFYEYGKGYRVGDYYLTHGEIARSKAGFTAQAMLDKYGSSGLSGHTHRLSFINRTQMGNIKTWIETGCLCNLQPTPAYMVSPDWCNGFVVGYEDKGKFYPQAIKIENNKFIFNGKEYI